MTSNENIIICYDIETFFCPALIGSNAVLFADTFGTVTEKNIIKYVSTLFREREPNEDHHH